MYITRTKNKRLIQLINRKISQTEKKFNKLTCLFFGKNKFREREKKIWSLLFVVCLIVVFFFLVVVPFGFGLGEMLKFGATFLVHGGQFLLIERVVDVYLVFEATLEFDPFFGRLLARIYRYRSYLLVLFQKKYFIQYFCF